MTKPIAVMTVTYSPGEYLADFLDSIEGATKSDTLVLLADNGSVDGVPEQAAQERENVEFWPTGGNIGYGSAMNFAARNLKSLRDSGEINTEYFVLSNPDVVFDAGSIDRMIECAAQWKSRGFRVADVGPYIRQDDGSAYPSARAVPKISTGIGHALLGTIWKNNPWSAAYRDDADMTHERQAGWLSGSCLLVSWEAFDAVAGFDERYFMYMEDVDLGDRFGQAGYINVFCPSAQITHAVGHSAGRHPLTMLPAHHDSAYRFQADRHPHWWQAPLRAALWVGLKVRAKIAVTIAQIKNRIDA